MGLGHGILGGKGLLKKQDLVPDLLLNRGEAWKLAF